MADDVSVAIISDVLARLGTITNPPTTPGATKYFLNGYFQAYDDESIFDKLKGSPLPLAAVVYEGMVAHSDNVGKGQPKHSHSIGASVNHQVSVIVAAQSDQFGQLAFKAPTMNTLALIRNLFMDTRSASGHYWRFVREQPAAVKKGVAVWVQTWQTPLILTGTPNPS